ncbi:flagellar alpha dynein [Microcoleus sp. B3-D7]|uniref:flagellar alpha dynein n=1 Tax=Microcoleus sp. B3-D7 TaxID=2818659 RepID=UPI002FCE825C
MASDTIIQARNQEIATLSSRLAAKDERIAELDEEIGRLDSELERRSEAISQNPIPKNPIPEVADLLNQLKARRKKSRAELADVELILEMIE